MAKVAKVSGQRGQSGQSGHHFVCIILCEIFILTLLCDTYIFLHFVCIVLCEIFILKPLCHTYILPGCCYQLSPLWNAMRSCLKQAYYSVVFAFENVQRQFQ